MKVSAAIFLAALVLGGVACQKESARVALQDGLAASMSDAQLLRVLKIDPATLHSKKEQGPDGYSTIYTDEQHEVWITRSVVSGVVVMRMKPKEDIKTWELGKP
jgi:hypothetical protein